MAITLKTVKQLDRLTTVPNTVDVIVNDANGVTKRAQLSDVLSLDNIPSAALERLVKVADQTARYALTTSDVQLGDSVLQLDMGIMYIVIDVSKLDSADGYEEYKAGTAAKAFADESGNNIKSNYANSLEISNGSIVLKNKNGTALSTETLPSSVGTFYGTETTASASAQAKTATVANNDFALADGVMVVIKFVNTNTFEATASNHITLNVNSTGAKSIAVKGNELPIGDQPDVFGRANYYHTFVYDGTYWVWQSCSKSAEYNKKIFVGTTVEWQALSNNEQDTYDLINLTDDDGTPRTFIGTHQEWDALSSSEKASYVFVEFIDDGGFGNAYDVPYGNNNVGNAIDNLSTIKANKTAIENLKDDATGILIDGNDTTNTTGSTITKGTYFYYGDALVKAKVDIANGATLTLNTNFELVTAGALNEINSALATLQNTDSVTKTDGTTNFTGEFNFKRVGKLVVVNFDFTLKSNFSGNDTVLFALATSFKPSTNAYCLITPFKQSSYQRSGSISAAANGNFNIFGGIASMRYMGTFCYFV